MSLWNEVLIIYPEKVAGYAPAGCEDVLVYPLLGRGQSKHVEIVIAEYGQEGKSPLTVSPCSKVMYILNGRIEIDSGKEKREINVNELVYLPAGLEHLIYAKAPNTRFLQITALTAAEKAGGGIIYSVDPEKVERYVPPGHDNTYNRLLVGPPQGCNEFEIIMGKFGLKGGAHPHSHSYEQLTFVLEGVNQNISNGIVQITNPGQLKFIPGGLEHQSQGLTETKFLLLYAPPRNQ